MTMRPAMPTEFKVHNDLPLARIKYVPISIPCLSAPNLALLHLQVLLHQPTSGAS